jgi:hypothetical protein
MTMRAQTAALATIFIAALGCSGGASSNDGGGGAGGAGGGGATGGGSGGATNATCQTIRLCAVDCADDACVQNNCKPMAPAAAQAAYQALSDCTTDPARGDCPSGSAVNQCLCMAQYLQDPPCEIQLADCIGNINDTIADLCH